jgi:predicted nucleic-acid-binding Zn-ribbon protein
MNNPNPGEQTRIDESIRERPCIHCGNADYTWANVTYFGHNKIEGNIQLRENNPMPRSQELPGRRWDAFLREPLLARKCNHCGNVQLFTTDIDAM